MIEGIQIREASLADARAISALAYGLSQKYVTPDFPEASGRMLLEWMTPEGMRLHMGSGVRYHVAELGGQVVGVVGVKNNKHLYHLFVDEALHHRGIARALWRVAMGVCMREGSTGEFTVNASRYAQGVYARFGFEVQGEPQERHGVITIPMVLRLDRAEEG